MNHDYTPQDARIEALIERELQAQDALQRRINALRLRQDAQRRRRQAAVVATLVNITSAAALVAIALIWQFYFPIANAVAAIVPKF